MGTRKAALSIVIILTWLTTLVLFTDKVLKSGSTLAVTEGSDQTLSINTFVIIPPQIRDGSCYFANDSIDFKNGRYIFMNDNAQSAFIKINGLLTKFTQTDLKKINKENTIIKYTNNQYQLMVEVKNGKPIFYETTIKAGTIILSDKNGNTLKRIFYGECG